MPGWQLCRIYQFGNLWMCFTAANGCDSTRTLRLTVLPTVSATITASICQGDNYAGHTSSGTYVDVYTAANGCDSTRTLHLTVKPVFNTTVTTAICQEIPAADTAPPAHTPITLPPSMVCDSTRTLHLTVKPTFRTTVTTDICEGENYAGHSNYRNICRCIHCRQWMRQYPHITPSQLNPKPEQRSGLSYAGVKALGAIPNPAPLYGCVSGQQWVRQHRTLILTVNPTQFTTVEVARCRAFLTLPAAPQTTSGIYYDTSRTFQGCDSIIKTILTIHPLPEPELGPYKRSALAIRSGSIPAVSTAISRNNMAISPILPATEIGIYALPSPISLAVKVPIPQRS